MANTNGTKLGRPRATDDEYVARFLSKINKTPSCWEWTDVLHSDGYGSFFFKKKNIKAHRFSFELFNESIKHDYVIDHICRNRKCVNPEHLRQVTKRENAIYNSESVSAKNLLKTHCPKGHAYDENNIGKRKDSRRKCKACARIYINNKRKLN